MRSCEGCPTVRRKTPNCNDKTQDPFLVPVHIPRIFLSAYLLYLTSYIWQIVQSQIAQLASASAVTSSVKPNEDLAILGTVLMSLIGLPVYNEKFRFMLRYAISGKPVVGVDHTRDEEDGGVEYEMKRDLRAAMDYCSRLSQAD
uniref:Uncharacterized protein n=1 Tax=Kwoniella dejecticola CBS 10117 TaxID=1296121 RepID=A0A1A6A295_9TREE|nr:uncharacterized protein I303_05044 [Kwoniella dejecticola CBS 10117]OBR84187.1 hypothetical protein I303_05044 [Kwoniella dejecticola CBS 10117]